MVFQSDSSPIAAFGTVALLALFLSGTAHLAARNVLGDVDPKAALYVGPLPATVAVGGGLLEAPAAVTVPVALLLDGVVIRWAYDQPPRRAAFITLIHFTITVILAVILGSLALLLATRPG